MKRRTGFFLGLLALGLFCLQSLSASGNVILTESEFQTLKITLQMADEQLEKSQTEISELKNVLMQSQMDCEKLRTLLNEQDKQLVTLGMQLDEALTSLSKLKSEQKTNNIIIVLAGVAGIVLGGSVVFLLLGGR